MYLCYQIKLPFGIVMTFMSILGVYFLVVFLCMFLEMDLKKTVWIVIVDNLHLMDDSFSSHCDMMHSFIPRLIMLEKFFLFQFDIYDSFLLFLLMA